MAIPDLQQFRQSPELARATLEEIYTIYRQALINEKYFAHRLTLRTRENSIYEIALAVGGSSALATWTIWKSGTGRTLWPIIVGIVSILAVVKPFLKLPEGAALYSRLLTGWRGQTLEMKDLASLLRVQRTLDRESIKMFNAAKERQKSLLLNEENEQRRPKLIKQITDEVNREVSEEDLWYPPEAAANVHADIEKTSEVKDS
jgi:hypothetical protein